MNVAISSHAVARYMERVKPALDYEQAEEELRRLVGINAEPGDPPSWLDESTVPPSDGYIELSDGICAAVVGRNVATVLTRTGCHPTHRANKNAAKARRRKAKQAQRRHVRRFKGSEPKELWR